MNVVSYIILYLTAFAPPEPPSPHAKHPNIDFSQKLYRRQINIINPATIPPIQKTKLEFIIKKILTPQDSHQDNPIKREIRIKTYKGKDPNLFPAALRSILMMMIMEKWIVSRRYRSRVRNCIIAMQSTL